jgi:Kef-type K+ transport system membrane component KefB
MDYFFEHVFAAFHLPLRNPVLIFSLILFIILLTPILLRKMRIPAIIGLILSGVIIGPNGLGLIGEKLLESDGSVKLFSTIGLLYIMFMAGLELDMKEFKKYRKRSFVFGFLTFALPLTLGFPICRYALGLDFTASLLTASMFATHTLVAYPIVGKFGISKIPAVAITVGGTILTDTAVLIILAIISSSVDGNLDASFWLRLVGSLLVFSVIMFFLIPRIARWFFSKLESEKTAHYIFVLSIVFFAAFLAEAAGVEHIIGAFVAGLVLNKLIPHTSSLMNRIDFIGNALFIPFFLISVGMVVNYNVFFQGPWALIVAAILTTFALFSKWLAALITQLLFNMTGVERQLIFGLSSSHAAATLAIIMVGFEKGILNNEVVNGTILLILITCMIASFVTENAGKNMLRMMAKEGDKKGNFDPLDNQHILLAINETRGNERLIDLSILMTDQELVSSISVVHVLPNDQEVERQIGRARLEMDEIVKEFTSSEQLVNVMVTIDHNLSSGISRVSRELVADTVVLNDSRKMNLLKRIVGDDRDHLLDLCNKTVFFCQLDKPSVYYKRILLIGGLNADLEPSFKNWINRVLSLAKELKIGITLYAPLSYYDRVNSMIQARKLTVSLQFNDIVELDDFFVANQHHNEDALIIYSAARSGSVSYLPGMESFSPKLEKAFPESDTILIYPSLASKDHVFGTYDDISSDPISKSVETIQLIGKEVGNIFKKGN